MGQIGSFDGIFFETSGNKIMTPKDMERAENARWEEHAVIGHKPIDEFIGPNLGTFKMNILLLNQFGVNPKKQMDLWLDKVRRGVVSTLIIGGVFGVDRWRLVSCTQVWSHVNQKGEIIAGELQLEFKEYTEGVW